MGTVIDVIKERIDIVDLVSASVDLKRSGKNYTGYCPFHPNSRTPALVVFPDTGTWRCFGSCNEGGSVIDWVLKENPGWDIREAITELAKKGNIPLERYDERGLDERIASRKKEDAFQIAARLMNEWLLEDEQALAYVHSRGISNETIKASGLGFSGRSSAAQAERMRGEFSMYGIDPESPQAAAILGYEGHMSNWCSKWRIDPKAVNNEKIHGIMSTPGLVYPHRIQGRIAYLSRRQLPGHDVFHRDGKPREWKSFNPTHALAGPKMPFFNHLHLRRRERLMIVEGQLCAITLAQWGIPAMALAGSSWRNIEEMIGALRDQYETIYFATDSDKAGQAVITGRDNDFPLAGYFGPMLWVAHWPKHTWVGIDGKERESRDANDLRQYYRDQGVSQDEEFEAVEEVLEAAAPIVLLAAKYAGSINGAGRQKALKIVLPLIAKMPVTARNDYRTKLAKALFPESGTRLQDFNKLVGDEIKKVGDGDDPAERVETMGGWYPVNDEGTEGYLIELVYDQKNQKSKLAYAHIFLDSTDNHREIEMVDYLDIDGLRYVPAEDDNIKYGTILLPSEMGKVKSTRELLAMLELFLRRYFLLDLETHYKFAALYALFTWVYDAFDSLMYLRARGGAGSGKSELMLRLGMLCYRMMITSGVSTLAGYKGLAHLYKGTLFIDEVDNLMKEDRGEMRALLNVRAMKKQARVISMMEVMRPDGTKSFLPSTTYVYGPTLMTMYGSFKDPGTESRCMTFDLAEKESLELDRAGIEPGYTPPEMDKEAQVLRNMLLNWRLRNWRPSFELSAELRKEYKLTDPLVSPRINQIMRPLKVLAVIEEDQQLFDDLKMLGQANYEDELNRRAGSFDAIIFRAVVAAAEDKDYEKYVYEGKAGKYGQGRYILYKDLAVVANEILDKENLQEGEERTEGGVKSNTIGTICRDSFRMPVHRTASGWAVVLDPGKIEIGKLRFGMDRDDPSTTPFDDAQGSAQDVVQAEMELE